jgi:lipopolysaccharide export system protein LptC
MGTRALSPWMRVRRLWDRASVYLPIVLMGVLALTTYWLVRTAPQPQTIETEVVARHEPDYVMRGFVLRVYGADGRLKNEVTASEGRHYPDTDTLELDQPRIRALNDEGRLTTARAGRGISNADGSEIQLFDQAVVMREAFVNRKGIALERSELQSDFLHLFANTERVRTHLPVVIVRGNSDRFTAGQMDIDNLDQLMQLQGRVHGTLIPRNTPKP